MPGLIALASFIVLLILLFIGAAKLADLFPIPVGARVALMFLMVIGFFPLMLIDEIIGEHQFKALCKTNGLEGVDISSIKGRYIKRESGNRRRVSGKIIPIRSSNEMLRDADSSKILLEYKDYYATGGWVVRYTPLGLGSSEPMLFDGNGCGFQLKDQIFSENRIIQVN